MCVFYALKLQHDPSPRFNESVGSVFERKTGRRCRVYEHRWLPPHCCGGPSPDSYSMRRMQSSNGNRTDGGHRGGARQVAATRCQTGFIDHTETVLTNGLDRFGHRYRHDETIGLNSAGVATRYVYRQRAGGLTGNAPPHTRAPVGLPFPFSNATSNGTVQSATPGILFKPAPSHPYSISSRMSRPRRPHRIQ